jgi:hypothetical protein
MRTGRSKEVGWRIQFLTFVYAEVGSDIGEEGVLELW